MNVDNLFYYENYHTKLSYTDYCCITEDFSTENIDEEASGAEIVERLTAKNRSEKGALISELQEKLNDALQKLSLKHRTVVILHEIEGLEHTEIAEITGTTIGTVRSRLHYAKQQLQSYLKEYIAQ